MSNQTSTAAQDEALIAFIAKKLEVAKRLRRKFDAAFDAA